MNKLFASLCWTGICALLIGLTDVIRYTAGPFHSILCYLQLLLKNTVKTEILLFYDAIALSRYIFIFRLKNPTAVCEDFWSLFASIWIVLTSTLVNLVHLLMPGPHILAYYVCCGTDPGDDLKLPAKKEGFILICSLIFQLFVNVRIIILKKSEKIPKALNFLIIKKSHENVNSNTLSESVSLEKQTIVNCEFHFIIHFYRSCTFIKARLFSFQF